MVSLSMLMLALPTVQGETLTEVLDAQEVSKMNAVISYIEQNPEAEDVGEAYNIVFRLALAYKQEAKVLPLAEKYLESGDQAAETKAVCIQINHLVADGKIEEAVDLFLPMVRYRSRRDPNAAGQCGFMLSDEAQLANRPDLTRKVMLVMREVLPLHPTYDRMCESKIKKIELVQKPAPEISVTDFAKHPSSWKSIRAKSFYSISGELSAVHVSLNFPA
ncbi:MAG: hypothetical protein R3C11_04350 [Planctomycetaceae bacterium]